MYVCINDSNDFNPDIDECASLPCINGGACFDQINGYTCQCMWRSSTGTNCETGNLTSIALYCADAKRDAKALSKS